MARVAGFQENDNNCGEGGEGGGSECTTASSTATTTR